MGTTPEDAKRSYTVEALRLRLDPGSHTLAAQDFWHTSQADEEKVADFIRRLERMFNVAYGREGMSVETRDTLLHGQLQDGLRHELMRAPAVSGAQSYQELCLAARNEEKRLAELRKRQQYRKSPSTPPRLPRKSMESNPSVPSTSLVIPKSTTWIQGNVSCATNLVTLPASVDQEPQTVGGAVILSRLVVAPSK